MLIISSGQTFTPERARQTGKPVVLIQGAIHSGVSEGKDAVLLLAHDMLIPTKHAELFEKVVF